VREIPVIEMPPETGGKWWALFREIVLRLEKPPSRAALRFELTDGSAAGARKALARYLNDRDASDRIIISYEITPDGAHVIYARRGPNWSGGSSSQ